MATALFHGSKLKIKRANQHIDELNGVLTSFLATDFYAMWFEHDLKTRQKLLKFRQAVDVPESVPAIIGDALHNLRAALDLMASELVSRAGNIPGKHVRFPIRESRQELEATIKGGEIKVAQQTVIDAILNVVKPYKGGNDAVCALHALDIMDKHLELVPTVYMSGVTFDARIGNATLTNCTVMNTGGREVNALSFPDSHQFQGKIKPALVVVFGKGQLLEGEPVIPTLHHLAQTISGILETIEDAYGRGIQPTT